MIRKRKLFNFLWVGFIFLTLIILLQYLSVRWSEKIKERISDIETSGGSIEIKE